MDPLEDISESHNYSPTSRGRWFLIGFGVIILVSILCAGFIFFRFFSLSQNLYTSLEEAESALKKSEISTAKLAFEDALYSLKDIESLFQTVSFIQIVPGVGHPYQETKKVFHAAVLSIRPALEITRITDSVSRVWDTDEQMRFDQAPEEKRMEVIQLLLQSLPALVGAHAELKLALQQLENVSDTHIKGPLLRMKEKLEKRDLLFEPLLDSSASVVKLLPVLAGYPEEKTYLFLLQNTNEVRATGGFIGTYGIIKVKNGILTFFKTDNIYNLDKSATRLHVPAPEPFRKYTTRKDREWFLRDSNWSPDFPTAAQKAEWFYEQEGGKENLDGVFSITPAVLVSLLKLTGPLTVENLTFTHENVVDQLQYQVEKGYLQEGLPSSERKEIIGTLGRMVLEKVMNLSQDKFHELYSLFSRHALEKDILVYFNDQLMQTFARDASWTGKVRSTEGDFLQIIDTNLIAMKTDKVMEKKITYNVVEHQEGHVTGRVELTYTNTGDYTWETGRYKDYVRLFIPEGSKIIDTKGAQISEDNHELAPLEVSHEHGKMVVGAFFTVEPKTTKTFFVEYQLPPKIYQDISRGSYSLLLQKQSGISKHHVDAHFSFLHDISSTDTQLKIIPEGTTGITFSTPSNTDHEIKIRFGNKQ